MSEEKINQFLKLRGVPEYIVLLANIQKIAHLEVVPFEVSSAGTNLFINGFIVHHQHAPIFADSRNVEDFRTWINMKGTQHYVDSQRGIVRTRTDDGFAMGTALNDNYNNGMVMERKINCLEDDTNNLNIGDMMENLDFFEIGLTTGNDTCLDHAVNNNEEVDGTHDNALNVNINETGNANLKVTVQSDTNNAISSVLTSTEHKNQAVVETVEVVNQSTTVPKQNVMLSSQSTNTVSSTVGKQFKKELTELNMLIKEIPWREVPTEFKKRFVCRSNPMMTLKEVEMKSTPARSRKKINYFTRVFQCECQQISLAKGLIKKNDIIDLQFSYSENDVVLYNNEVLYLYHVKTREVSKHYATSHFEKVLPQHNTNGKTSSISFIYKFVLFKLYVH
jgi:hypothetical protein